MSIFGSIWHKITGTEAEPAASTEPAATPAEPTPVAITEPAASTEPAATPAEPTPVAITEPAATPAATPTATAATMSEVDVEKILTDLATQKGKPSNWKVSIVDFLILLDIDSSLSARTELAEELNVHAGAHGSAEQNTALHRAVMQKLEENGGKVPDSLKG